jgi:hypothetical protein
MNVDKLTVLFPYTCNTDSKTKKIHELKQLQRIAEQNSETVEAARIALRILELQKFGETS